MRISKTAVLALSFVLSIAGLGLMVVSADKDLSINLDNAVQQIEKVILISDDASDKATIKYLDSRLVGIITNNFVLSETGADKNILLDNANNGSSVLGGKRNQVGGSYNVILAGYKNSINGAYNTILGGEENTITGSLVGSTILGGKSNTIEKSNSSAIVGGHTNLIKSADYSVILGSDSYVSGNNSAALGLNSNVDGSNSFLWSDGENQSWGLNDDNLFAVFAKSGMVIGLDEAHNFAKLTLGRGIVIENDNSTNSVKCGLGEGGGILKAVKYPDDDNRICMCSCDGSGWNSLFGVGRCATACGFPEPKCGGPEVTRLCIDGEKTYTGSCVLGKVVEGTGAYFIDKDNVVHWSCQTDEGTVKSCTGTVTYERDELCIDSCGGDKPTGNRVLMGEDKISSDAQPQQWTYLAGVTQSNLGSCEWSCEIGYIREGNTCVKMVCGGNLPNDLDGVYYGSNEYSDLNYTPKEWKYTPNNPPQACQYTCKDNYKYNSQTNNCDLIQKVEGCTGTIIANAHKNNEIVPSTQTEYTYNDTNKNLPCTYSCDDEYRYDITMEQCLFDPNKQCGNKHYECVEGASFVPESSNSVVNARKIRYTWKCKKGGISQECYEDVEYSCHHCAVNGFPYCFPINFDQNCKEGNYL